MGKLKKKREKDVQGKTLYIHYYTAGEHIYEFPRKKGQPASIIAFRRTPKGDGEMLWQKNDGLLRALGVALQALSAQSHRQDNQGEAHERVT